MTESSEDIYEFLHTKWRYSKDEKKNFKISPRKKKRFSRQEVVRLTSNIKRYLSENQLTFPDDIKHFIDPRKRYRNANFYKNISNGICRTLYSIYRHVHRRYSHLLYQRGPWGAEEEQQLLHLVETHKGDWNVIAESLGRSRIDCIDKMATSAMGEVSVGRWEQEETGRLMESVCYQLTQKGLGHKLEEPLVLSGREAPKEVTVSSQIDWKLASRHVSTRTSHQCIAKWANSLSTDMDHPMRRWNNIDDVTLIEIVLRLKIRDEYNVNWLEVLKQGKWKGRTSSWIQSKWSRLVHCIPGYRAKYFYQHCLYLKENTLPVIKRYLAEFLQAGTSIEEDKAGNRTVESQDTNITNSTCNDPT